MMKEYKIDLSMLEGEAREDVSAAIQRHAFRLGYKWQYGGKKTQYEYCPVLCFEADGRILKNENIGGFNKWSNTEISITDFLALKPEDVKEKPVPEFKPDQLVLAREYNDGAWCLCHFSHRWENGRFCVGDSSCEQCIPYEGNEHLLGKTEEPK